MAERRLQVEQIGDVTVVRFTSCNVLDEATAHLVGRELFELVEEDGHRQMLLNLAAVEFLTSTALGKLVTLHKKLRSRGGKLKICGVPPKIRVVFQITKLDTVFDLFEDEAAGLIAFATKE